jgi:hypothetical protein
LPLTLKSNGIVVRIAVPGNCAYAVAAPTTIKRLNVSAALKTFFLMISPSHGKTIEAIVLPIHECGADRVHQLLRHCLVFFSLLRQNFQTSSEVSLEIAVPQHKSFSGLKRRHESAECIPFTTTYWQRSVTCGQPFDHRQLQHADASPNCYSIPALKNHLFLFKLSFSD